MVIENKLHLPQALVDACGTTKHNAENCISATTLLQGTKQIILTDRHWDDLTDDVSDRIWAVFGTAVHSLLQDKNTDGFAEERFACKVGSKTVTGQVDLYNMSKAEIDDYKTASVWKIIHGDFADWHRQGLIYAWLLKQENLEVRRCRFIAMLKDFSKTKAKVDSTYPQSPVFVYEFDVTDDDLEDIEKFIRYKVEDIERCEKLADDDIHECNSTERWETETTWAVMKEGRKSAVRVLNDESLANKLCESLGKGHWVEKRQGESKRCGEYCSCCDYCHFYKNIK